MVGLTLASGLFGVSVERVIGVGIKVAWTEEEIQKMSVMATRSVTVFTDRTEAVGRGLRLAGLQGLVDATSTLALAGVIEAPGGYRSAFDPAVNGIGAPPMRSLVAVAECRLTLARGMVSLDQLRAHDPAAIELSGLGHNAHVEDAERLWHALLPS